MRRWTRSEDTQHRMRMWKYWIQGEQEKHASLRARSHVIFAERGKGGLKAPGDCNEKPVSNDVQVEGSSLSPRGNMRSCGIIDGPRNDWRCLSNGTHVRTIFIAEREGLKYTIPLFLALLTP